MKLTTKGVILSISLLCASLANATDETLNVPLTIQDHSEWCWAASSAAVLNYYGHSLDQCNVVNWAFGINYACGDSDFNWSDDANSPNNIFGSSGSVQDILYNWGINTIAVSNYLSWQHITSDINAHRPFVIRYGWTSGGGHIMVGRGYEVDNNGDAYLYIMNPWPGEGMTFVTYDYAISASDHNWTHSIRTIAN